MHLQPVYVDCDGSITGVSEMLFAQGVTLPSGSGMTAEQFASVERVITSMAAA